MSRPKKHLRRPRRNAPKGRRVFDADFIRTFAIGVADGVEASLTELAAESRSPAPDVRQVSDSATVDLPRNPDGTFG